MRSTSRSFGLAVAVVLLMSACYPRRSFQVKVALRPDEVAAVYAFAEGVATRMNCVFREGEPRWKDWESGKGAVCNAAAPAITRLLFQVESSSRKIIASVEWSNPQAEVPADVQAYAQELRRQFEARFGARRIKLKTTFWPSPP